MRGEGVERQPVTKPRGLVGGHGVDDLGVRARPPAATAAAPPGPRSASPPIRRTIGVSRDSTRYSLPGSSTIAERAPHQLGDVVEIACTNGHRPSSCTGTRATPGCRDGRPQQCMWSRPRTAAGSGARDRRWPRPPASPTRPTSPRPERRSGHRPRLIFSHAADAVLAHAGEHDAERPLRVHLGDGTEQHVHGRADPVLRALLVGDGAHGGAVTLARDRWKSPGAISTVPGTSDVAVLGLPYGDRATLVCSRCANSRVNSGGMCWTMTTGTGKSAGSWQQDRRERVRSPGGGADRDDVDRAGGLGRPADGRATRWPRRRRQWRVDGRPAAVGRSPTGPARPMVSALILGSSWSRTLAIASSGDEPPWPACRRSRWHRRSARRG